MLDDEFAWWLWRNDEEARDVTITWLTTRYVDECTHRDWVRRTFNYQVDFHNDDEIDNLWACRKPDQLEWSVLQLP